MMDFGITSRGGRSGGGNQAVPLFDTHIVVDWSALSEPSPKKEGENAIWWTVARIVGGSGVEVEQPKYERTRHKALDNLTCRLACELDRGHRLLVGFDFPFGYPAGVAERVTGKACAMALWDWLAGEIKDAPDNTNNRYDVAAKINEMYPGCGPFWGRHPKWDCPTIPLRASERTEQTAHPEERRICEMHATDAKTVWQLFYAGAVGSQVLLGLPALRRLMEDPRIRNHAEIWPFQTGLRTPNAQIVVAEVYPSLLQTAVRARQREKEIPDRAQVRVNAEAFARLDAQGRIASIFAGPPDLTDGQRRLIQSEEGWILGLGHEDDLKGVLDPGKENVRKVPQSPNKGMGCEEVMEDEEILLACPPSAPTINLLWTAIVDVGYCRDLGASSLGHRFIVPITGGRVFDGPASHGLAGRVLPGGADRQILRPDGVKELDALYEMQTDAGQIITVRNRVIVDPTHQPDRYVMSVITAKVAEGSLDWLNRRILIGTLQSMRPEHPKVVVRAWVADNR